MAEKAAELTIVFRAKNLLKNALDKVGKQIDDKLSKIRQFQNEIRAISKAGIAIGVVGATLFTGAIVQAAGFEKALSNVAAVTQASIEDQKRLRDAALEQGSKSVFAASEAAEAQLFLGQAGQSTTEIIQSLSGVLSLAAATSSELGFSAEVTAATLSQFSLDAGEASRVANVFAASSSASQATLDKLAFAMRQAGPIANSLGLSLEETTAALNLLFNAGFKGEQAGTILRGTLSSLIKPSSEAAEILNQLGIQINDTSGTMLPFIEIIKQLEKVNLNTAQAIAIFGQEAGPGLVALLSQGSEALQDMEARITGTDEAARQAKVRTDNLAGSITFMKSAIEGASITIGSEYIPVIRLVTELITGLVSSFNALDPATKSLVANFALGATVITGFAGALGLLVTALAVSTISFAVVGTALGGFLLLIGKGILIAGAFFAGFKFAEFLLDLDSAKLSVLDFLEIFETGWIGLKLVINSVIAVIALGLQSTFNVLRATILKPLDLIFEALKKIKKSIDINPFDVIESGLDSLQSHTEEVVVNIAQELNQVNEKYDAMRSAIETVSDSEVALKNVTDDTTKAMKDQVAVVDNLAEVSNEALAKSKANAEALRAAYELTGLVSTEDSVLQMDALAKATGLLLEAGNLTIDQERELIKIFTEKANTITGVTRRLDEMTEAAGEYNSALDRLLSVRLNSLQGDLEKNFDNILDPSTIKKNAQEAERILIAFSNKTEGANGEVLSQIQSGGLVDTDALAEYKKRVAEGEEVTLSFIKTSEGLVTSVKNTSEGYGALTFSMSATEKKINDIKSALRAHQDELDNLFNGPINAQDDYIDKLKESGASIEQLGQAENRLMQIQSSRALAMIGAEDAALTAVQKIRAQNLKDIEENNAKILALEQSRASIAQSLKDIDIRRSEAGLSQEQKRNLELSRLQQDLLTAPVLSEDKQTETLSRIAQRASQISNSAKEGGVQFNEALNIAEQAFRKLDALQDLQILKGKGDGVGLEADARRVETVVASMGEAIDGFSQNLKFFESEIANANLTMAVEMLDNATGPGEEIRNNLENLFGSPITQEIIVRQTNAAPRFSGGSSGGSDDFFSDGIEFQASSPDSTGFGEGVVTVTPLSFASGIRYIQKDALVKVHKGEEIVDRVQADRNRRGDGLSRSVTFSGDIVVQVANSTEAPQVTAERLREEIKKLDELDRG